MGPVVGVGAGDLGGVERRSSRGHGLDGHGGHGGQPRQAAARNEHAGPR